MRKTNRRRGNAILEFGLVAGPLMLLFYGTVALGLNLGRSIGVTQVSRDVCLMYARGVDFSNAGAHDLVEELATGMDLSSSGNGVVILSQVMKVFDADCVAGGQPTDCPNRDQIIFSNRLVIGNSSLRASNLGTPSGMSSRGDISSAVYLREANARVSAAVAGQLAAAGVAQQPGEIGYVVEAWFNTPELNPFGNVSSEGTYARTIF
jgi:hypothetical protein